MGWMMGRALRLDGFGDRISALKSFPAACIAMGIVVR
jgi:hypothetical protein